MSEKDLDLVIALNNLEADARDAHEIAEDWKYRAECECSRCLAVRTTP